MESSTVKKVEHSRVVKSEFLNTIFSWSFHDILNKDLYKNEMKEIPETFGSVTGYMQSFQVPLLEETREYLSSEMVNVSKAAACEITALKPVKSERKPPKGLYYNMKIKRIAGFQGRGVGRSILKNGDVLAITDLKPQHVEDINRPKIGFLIAFVQGSRGNSMQILLSKPVECTVARQKLFAVCLGNLTTNLRIWEGLNPAFNRSNLSVIENVLQRDCLGDRPCPICESDESFSAHDLNSKSKSTSELDESQREAH